MPDLRQCLSSQNSYKASYFSNNWFASFIDEYPPKNLPHIIKKINFLKSLLDRNTIPTINICAKIEINDKFNAIVWKGQTVSKSSKSSSKKMNLVGNETQNLWQSKWLFLEQSLTIEN